jgi:predicted membrane protein
MWGISSGFIHGVGFYPHRRLWRTLFHPLGGWPLMGLGYLILWRAQG